MKKNQVRAVVSVIVIFGHLLVFLLGLLLGVFNILRGTDAIQTLLMASPVLATTAFAAFSTALSETADQPNRKVELVTKLSAILVVTFPVILLGVILTLFYVFYKQIDGFGPDQLKISLGGVETFFGVYLGAISKFLFKGR